ncbi:thioredoxin [Natroniella sulfidigena]|uniref:thioredoxin n=1 Tax=Natroniella sulfidigena TaxID=723921 RepID=UPI00200AF426|nr:thioredoxin [Natroniella sulfidigena]MCK8816966.1 thioredoxin [Natroniella sulfidigena]
MADKVIEVNENDFKEKVVDAEVPVVVDFWAPWCGPCKAIAPVLDEIADEYEDQIKVVKVNVDDNQTLAQEYQVTSIPNIIFFKEGEQVEQQVGFASKDGLVSKIDSIT